MRIIGGQWRGKQILPPPGTQTRPTADRTREMIFNVLLHNPAFTPLDFTQKRVLDVFAGTGALGLEALSRGAQTVTFIESHPDTLTILRKNLSAVSADRTQVMAQDARTLPRATHAFDLVFLDPPYGQDLLAPTLTRLFEQGWLASDAILVMEMDKTETPALPAFVAPRLERTAGRAKVCFAVW